MSLVLADAGPLYAAAARDDDHHSRSQSELASLEFSGTEVIVVHSTLLETYGLIQRRVGIRFSIDWLELTRSTVGLFAPIESDYDLALDLVGRYPDQDITLFDAVLHVVSRRTGIPVWSYDHHFDVLGTARWHPNG